MTSGNTSLQTIETKSRTLCCAPELPDGLGAILERAHSVQDLPACGAKGRALLEQSIAEHERALVGADRGTIEDMLSGLSVAFPASRVSEVEANARLEMYASELADIPADILRTAMRRSVRECDFFPTVKELRKLAGPEMAMRAWRLMMMKHMAKEYDRRKPEGEPLTDEQRAQLPSLIKSSA